MSFLQNEDELDKIKRQMEEWDELACVDCDCMKDEGAKKKAVVELELPPLKVAKPHFEVEIEFNDDVVSGMYTDNVDTIYIEDDEVRLVDGPIAQVISLDDIRYLRANIR